MSCLPSESLEQLQSGDQRQLCKVLTYCCSRLRRSQMAGSQLPAGCPRLTGSLIVQFFQPLSCQTRGFKSIMTMERQEHCIGVRLFLVMRYNLMQSAPSCAVVQARPVKAKTKMSIVVSKMSQVVQRASLHFVEQLSRWGSLNSLF